MATRKQSYSNPYEKIESIVMNRVFELENENAQLKNEMTAIDKKITCDIINCGIFSGAHARKTKGGFRIWKTAG